MDRLRYAEFVPRLAGLILCAASLCWTACGSEVVGEFGNPGDADGQASGDDTTGDGGGDETGDGGGGDYVPDPYYCNELCHLALTCQGEDEEICQSTCTMSMEDAAETSEACIASVEAALDCVATLECMTYIEYKAKQPGYPCEAEDQASAAACG